MEENGYIVYKHTNKINGKVYIGITRTNVELRWRSDGSGYRKCPKFYNAIKKYGWDNFSHEILFTGLSKEEACTLEIALISKYTREGISYNISGGGEGCGIVSEETKEKLRQYRGEKASMFGKHPSKETIAKRLKTMRERGHYDNRDTSHLAIYRLRKGKDSPMYGRKPSEKTLESLRTPVVQFTLDGKYITEFASLKDASEAVGVTPAAIANSIKGKTIKAGGYLWEYKSNLENIDYSSPSFTLVKRNSKVKKKILRISGEESVLYSSISEAAKVNNINRDRLCSYLLGRSHVKPNGYDWKYVTEYE